MSKDSGPFEIPVDIRTAAERGIEQARTAFDRFMDSAKTGLEAVEDRSKVAQDSARDIRTTVMSFAEQNMAKTVRVRAEIDDGKGSAGVDAASDRLHSHARWKALSQQAKALGESVTRAAADFNSRK